MDYLFDFGDQFFAADTQIVEHLSQAADYLVSLHFPEGAYFKGLICYKAA